MSNEYPAWDALENAITTWVRDHPSHPDAVRIARKIEKNLQNHGIRFTDYDITDGVRTIFTSHGVDPADYGIPPDELKRPAPKGILDI